MGLLDERRARAGLLADEYGLAQSGLLGRSNRRDIAAMQSRHNVVPDLMNWARENPLEAGATAVSMSPLEPFATAADVGLSAKDVYDAIQKDDWRGAAISGGLGLASAALPFVGYGAIKAWQGSPHTFAAERKVRGPDGSEQYIVGAPDTLTDVPEGYEVLRDYPLGRMRMDKMGTGEGAQAYGHGMYTAESRGLGENYRKNLSYKQTVRDFREALPDDAEFDDVMDLVGQGHFSPYQETVLRALEADDWLGFGYPSQAISAAYRNLDDFDPSPALKNAVSDSGRLYEVEIDADAPDFLDWDLPIDQQSSVVQKAFKRMGYDPRSRTARADKIIHDLKEDMRLGGRTAMDAIDRQNYELAEKLNMEQVFAAGSDIAPRGVEDVRKFRAAGIKGIRYKDGMSRGKDGGTYNYVVFDDDLIDIKNRE